MEAFLDILEVVGCILFVIFFLGFCVFIHELGHFLTAKLCGLHVNAFSLGFKKAWGKKINGVDYRIGWLPFGGYVDIPQIDSTEIPHTAEGKELPPAKPVHRLLSAFAGPFFNILFGLALGCVVWYFGVPQNSPKMRELIVASIDKAGPEYAAGLRKGDKIFKVNGETFHCSWNDFVFKKLLLSIGKIKLDVKRDNKTLEVTYIPKQNPNAPERMKFEKMPWPYFKVRIPILMYPKPGSPAAKAGMKAGDELISFNGKSIQNRESFFGAVNYCGGKDLFFEVKRKGKIIKLPPLKPELHKNAAENTKDDYKIGVLFIPDLKVAGIVYGSPAEQAGVKLKDTVQKINGTEVKNFEDFKKTVTLLKDKPFVMTIKRGKENVDIKLAAVQPRIYDVGISVMILDHPTPWQQFMNVVDMSYKSLRGLTITFFNYIGVSKKRSSISTRNLSGPIGLATTLYESVRIGTFRFGLYFVVLVSFALAIFNLLPLPVLDGGHMALALIEIVIRKPLHEGTVKALTFIFIFLLIALMIYVTYFDILRRLSPEWQSRLDPDQALKETKVPVKTVTVKKDVKKTPVKTD